MLLFETRRTPLRPFSILSHITNDTAILHSFFIHSFIVITDMVLGITINGWRIANIENAIFPVLRKPTHVNFFLHVDVISIDRISRAFTSNNKLDIQSRNDFFFWNASKWIEQREKIVLVAHLIALPEKQHFSRLWRKWIEMRANATYMCIIAVLKRTSFKWKRRKSYGFSTAALYRVAWLIWLVFIKHNTNTVSACGMKVHFNDNNKDHVNVFASFLFLFLPVSWSQLICDIALYSV